MGCQYIGYGMSVYRVWDVSITGYGMSILQGMGCQYIGYGMSVYRVWDVSI